MREAIAMAFISIIFVVLVFLILNWATDPEQWYAGMHDSKCEQAYGERCNCYHRLVEQDKERKD